MNTKTIGSRLKRVAKPLQSDNAPSEAELDWSQGIRQLLIERGGEVPSEVDVVKGGDGAVTRTA